MQQLEFELSAEFIELNNLLKVMGLCDSGGAAKQLIAQGHVYVNDQQELRKTCKIRAGQIVRWGDVQISVVGKAPQSP
jgi:ribosome-associated protein